MANPEIDRLESILREYAKKFPHENFQDVVVAIRKMPTHELHKTAVEYNRLVYEMQNPKTPEA